MRGIAVDGNGDVIATGELDSAAHSENFFVVKLAAADGAEKWRFLHDTGGFIVAHAIAVNAANDVVAVGNTPFADTKGQSTSLYAVKLDHATGAVVWEYEPRNPKGNSNTDLYDVAFDGDGNVLTGGTSASDRGRISS